MSIRGPNQAATTTPELGNGGNKGQSLTTEGAMKEGSTDLGHEHITRHIIGGEANENQKNGGPNLQRLEQNEGLQDGTTGGSAVMANDQTQVEVSVLEETMAWSPKRLAGNKRPLNTILGGEDALNKEEKGNNQED